MIDTCQSQEYWNIPVAELIQRLNSNEVAGLSSLQAKEGLKIYGKNLMRIDKKKDSISLLVSQFKTPIMILFILTSLLSLFLDEAENALIILIILAISGVLGFWQEKRANDVVNKLLSIIQPRCDVIRDGKLQQVISEDVI
ncbi:MAG TPA: cation-transporting P-type ATPase, partial [Nitrososphaeraceae archaeon]